MAASNDVAPGRAQRQEPAPIGAARGLPVRSNTLFPSMANSTNTRRRDEHWTGDPGEGRRPYRRALLVTHYFSTHRGGVELVAAALARRLVSDHGWTLTWIASDTDAPPDDVPEGVSLVRAPAWNWAERRLGVPWPVWSSGGLRAVWREVGRANVLHLHDALYLGNAFAWVTARLRGVPVIVTQHVGAVPYSSAWLRRLHLLANRTVGRLILSGADQVVFVSPAVRGEFASFCRFRSPPVYCPNGLDTDVFNAAGRVAGDSVIVKAHGEGRMVVLFVGRFVEKKGLPMLRLLADKHRNVQWVLAGSGRLDPADWGLPNVLVVRDVKGAALARYYRAADLLVLPSRGEGFPLVVQEAMACGTPVLVSEDTAAGCPAARPVMYVEPVGSADSVDRWSARIERLWADREALRARRAECAGFAMDSWSWKSTADVYATLMAALVSRAGIPKR